MKLPICSNSCSKALHVTDSTKTQNTTYLPDLNQLKTTQLGFNPFPIYYKINNKYRIKSCFSQGIILCLASQPQNFYGLSITDPLRADQLHGLVYLSAIAMAAPQSKSSQLLHETEIFLVGKLAEFQCELQRQCEEDLLVKRAFLELEFETEEALDKAVHYSGCIQ